LRQNKDKYKILPEHKKAEKLLQQSEERFRSVLNNSLDVVYRLNLQTGRYEYMSPSCKKTLGFEVEELMAMSNEEVFSRVHPDDLHDLKSELLRIGKEGRGVSEYRFKSKAGKYSWWLNQMVVTKDENGKPLYRDGFVRNITETKKAEQALKLSEEKFSKAFKNSPTAMTLTRLRDGKIIDVNDSALELFGFTLEESVGQTVIGLGVWANPAEREELAKTLKEKRYVRNQEIVLKRKDGTRINTIASVSLIEIDNEPYLMSSVVDITERKKAEEALKQSVEKERFLADIIRRSSVAVGVGYPDGRLGMVNHAFEELTGYSAEELQNITWNTMLTPKEYQQLEKQKLDELLQNKTPIIYEKEYIRKDGVKVPIELVVHQFFNEEGAVSYFFSFISDISKRKKAEKEIADLARFPMENPAAVLRVDGQGIVMFANPSAQNFLKKWQTKVGGHIPERIRSIVVDSMASNDRTEFEEKLGEEIFAFLITPIISEGYVNLYGRAITKRKKAEEKLKEYTKDLEAIVEERTRRLELNALYARSLIEASLDPLVTINSEGKITDVNNATEYATGFSREQLVGSDFSNYFTEPEKAAAGYTQVFTNGFIKDYPLAIKHKLGKTTEVLYNATIYRDAEGKVQGVFAAARDITQRKMLEKKLQESERLAAIGATAGMVGHDIRNPLQAITSDVYLLRSELAFLPKGETKKNIKESLDGIDDNVQYVNKIVQDLQDYARPLAPVPREIDVERMCEEVLFKNDVPENVDVSYKVEGKARKFVVDADILKRVLTNLVNNAVQAMPEGGKLSVDVYRNDESTIIEIGDTGPGIPEDVKPKLFTPLFTTKSKGQGFGLAVVKRLTEALGGTVNFESKIGEGTKFIVSLPTKKADG
jgi:PAS domain S-box-containing protein